jgi:sugar phosphate isomerase/epimerase
MSTPPVSPAPLPPDALILANGSLPPVAFEERVAAAAGAGFDAIGLSVWEYDRLRGEGYDDNRLRSALNRHGMRVAELEVVLGFAAIGPDRLRQPLPGLDYTDRDTEARFFEMATLFGARHLQTVGTFNSEKLEDQAVEAFAALCDRAAAYELLVALEFVPSTNIPDAGTATEIVTAAGRSNGGLCVDSWHHFRGHNDDRLLRAIPPEKVFMIQLDDGAAHPVDPDFITDTVLHRLPPGDGDFDLPGFLTILWSHGVQAPISVEVLSAELSQEPPDETAQTLAKATRNVVTAARRSGIGTAS